MHGSRRANVWSSPLWAVGTQVNINGLLNAHDVTDVIAHECPSVDSDFTIALYKAALEKHPEAESIYIITDNARYYLSKKLREWVGGTKIKQIFLSPYSPNLNLIERLWKFLRKEIINTKFYRTKHEFRDVVFKFFDNIASYRKETRVASNSELPRTQFAIHFWLRVTEKNAQIKNLINKIVCLIIVSF